LSPARDENERILGGFSMKKFAAAAFLGALIGLAAIDDGFSQSPFYAGKTESRQLN
jgi:hypothetical protein